MSNSGGGEGVRAEPPLDPPLYNTINKKHKLKTGTKHLEQLLIFDSLHAA